VVEFHFQNESNSASNWAVDLEVILKGVLTLQFAGGGGRLRRGLRYCSIIKIIYIYGTLVVLIYTSEACVYRVRFIYM
jgi:hypothetical protein